MAYNWRGLQPPTLGKVRSPIKGEMAGPLSREMRRPVGSIRHGMSAVGRFEVGKRTRSRKLKEVFG